MIPYLQKYGKVLIAIIIIAVILLSTNKGYKMYQTFLDSEKEKLDSLMVESRKKQDSLKLIISANENTFTIQQEIIDKLEKSNRYYYRKLKQREKDLLIIDTSFINNARTIADRANRQYKANDSIK